MNFSTEEIFFMYGQYDKFVSLSFHIDSEAFNKYGHSIMGTFKYSLKERQRLEQAIANNHNQRTNDYVRFDLSRIETLDESLIADLEKKGILSGDIQ